MDDRKIHYRIGKIVRAMLAVARANDDLTKAIVKRTRDPFGVAQKIFGTSSITVNEAIIGVRVPLYPEENDLRSILERLEKEDVYEQLYQEVAAYVPRSKRKRTRCNP